MEDSNKITEIEYLRGFAILAVVAIHTSVFFTKMQSINALLITNVFIYIFSHFAVPLFVFISAFVLYLKYKNSFSQKIFYAKRAKSILPQYLIFSLIYLLVASFGTFFIDGSVQLPSVPEIIFKFLTASSYYHLWFFCVDNSIIFIVSIHDTNISGL